MRAFVQTPSQARPPVSMPVAQRAAGARIQRKPTVSSPGDAFEREADDLAEKVMRVTVPAAIGSAPPAVQRKCAQCEEEDERAIQTKRAPSSRAGASLDTGAAVRATERGGAPLSPEARAYFEPRLGFDFGRVRIHADDQAADAARAVQARAFALGSAIVFGAGEYAPTTDSGKRLLAHELVHVVQQTGGTPARSASDVDGRAPVDVLKRAAAGAQVQRDKASDRPDLGLGASPPDASTADKSKPAEPPAPAPEKMTNCRSNYLVESWEADTCCVNHGFLDPSATNKSGDSCCNTFPRFVDDEAANLGFDGAASCRSPRYLNHRARVTPKGSSTSVEVLCVDTRARAADRVIELGFRAAMKAYGSTAVKDPKATVCIGDKAEAKTCYAETDCDKTSHPTESTCLPRGCSKSAPAKAPPKPEEP
ncbi:MAG TPA: DUF4157 domain-containing protein, partial [Myxococcota bacterium]|nr:DUF4157 domain-containing protein [Myxococcota bacterium]